MKNQGLKKEYKTNTASVVRVAPQTWQNQVFKNSLFGENPRLTDSMIVSFWLMIMITELVLLILK